MVSAYIENNVLEMEKKNNALSGRDLAEVQRDILRRAIRLKERVIERYMGIAEETNLDHVRSILKDIIEREREDVKVLQNAVRTGKFLSSGGADIRDYELMDHLIADEIEEFDKDDLASVLKMAIKVSNDLMRLFSLMATEYQAHRWPMPSLPWHRGRWRTRTGWLRSTTR